MKKARVLMVIGAILILAPFFLPMWSISLEAPQYRDPLTMKIFINRFEDGNFYDIHNINLMNHYVGMKPIPETIPEFKIFPVVLGIMSVLGIIVGLFMDRKWFLIWFIVMALLATAGLIDFYMWETDFGHNLDPKASIKIIGDDGERMGFQPPFLGTKHILNFIARSYPDVSAYILGLGMISTLSAYFVGKKSKR